MRRDDRTGDTRQEIAESAKVGILFEPTESSPTPQLHNTPALFAVLVLPYAFTTSITVLLMPYLLRKYGISVDQIAKIVVVANLPTIWSFFWSPLADVGLRKRSWIVFSALSAGLAGGAAILGIHGSQALLTALLFVMNAFAGLLSSACGALLTAMPVALRGLSSGWYQGGNTGGAAIGGGLFIWLADHTSLPVVAVLSLAAIMLPALGALLIREPSPIRRAIGPQVTALGHDMGDLLRSRRTWIGLVFLLSPVGSAAIGNLISGMGQDYRASGNEVLWVTGIGGGLLSALGCFIGGIVADRIGRMFAYALAGGLAALFAVYLGFAHATPFTYAAGYSGYAVSAGFAYAVFTAMVLDILGRRKHAAASGYAVLNSAGNLPIVYMTWLDGLGYQQWGARGLVATDAAANGGFGIVLLLVAIFLGRHWTQADEPG
jgi:MFS transporter, PAT family, beta-lactamase induction signal transducer AmpG